jgi:hypothetical protein
MPVTYRFQLARHDTAYWTGVDPVLLEGEPGYDETAHVLKIGDGVSGWNALPALVSDAAAAAAAQVFAADAEDSATDAAVSAADSSQAAAAAATYAATAQSSGTAAMDAATSAAAASTSASSQAVAAAASADDAATASSSASSSAALATSRAQQVQVDIARNVVVAASVASDGTLTLTRQDATSVVATGSAKGPPGPVSALASAVSVSTGAPGTAATAVVTGQPGSQALALTLPRGDTGAPGLAIVTHGTDVNAARPDSPVVYWVGAARPVNALPTDLWKNA